MSGRTLKFTELFLKILLFLIFSPKNSQPLVQPECSWAAPDNLICSVTPGSHLIIEEEVFGIGPEHSKTLSTFCAQNTIKNASKYEGNNPNNGGFVLSHGVFMSVPNLESLSLINCKIAGITPGALSYLPNLVNLTLRASTSLSKSPLNNLDIKSGVLRGLPNLEILDLSTTSLSSLPLDLLCFLPALNYLNLSSCTLRDFSSIGVQPLDPTKNNCENKVTVLDLSRNHFSLLPPATFITLKNLIELRLESNSLTLAAERALLGLVNLEILSIAGNDLTSLPPEFFKDNKNLKEIYLQNNSLSVLAPGLFNGLENLVSLDLSYNELTSDWVSGETFKGLLRLIYLNLGNNQLTKIDSILFKDLYSLQILNLESNKIATINEDSLGGMFNLHTLILSHNNLIFLDSRICNGLQLLSYLIVDSNKIERIESESFKNCSRLEDLNLSGNKLKNVPVALNSLSLLRTLDLGENVLTEINNSSFEWLPNLYGLRLTGNKIQKIEKNSFKALSSLKIVNLAENNISKLIAGTFDNNPNLHAVRLDVNNLRNISGLFINIPNLLWLNISRNELSSLEYEEFPPRLQLLNLQHNKINTLGSCSNVNNLRIRTLDLSHNEITTLSTSTIPDSIEKLLVSYNKIASIQPYTFFRKPNLTRVDLSGNSLRQLDQNSIRLSPKKPSTIYGNVEFFLANNPLLCDCSMDWLQNIHEENFAKVNENGPIGSNYHKGGENGANYPIILDATDVKCALSFEREKEEGISYLKIPPNQFLCKYESHCFPSCHCCDFDACDCEMSCPKNCSCYHDSAWSVNVVDCSSMDKNEIPARIPMDVTQVFLDGNFFPNLDSHSFIGRKNLRALYLNASHIETIQNRSFSGLRNLKLLHLDNNFIERLEGFEFSELESLEELHLEQNSLVYVQNSTFSKLTSLKFLYLHGNNFVNFPIWSPVDFGALSDLREVSLRGNEWSCECEFATNLKEWLREFSGKIVDGTQVQCVDQVIKNSHSEEGELVVVRLLEQRNHRCTTTTDLSIKELSQSDSSSSWANYLPLLIASSSIILLLLLLLTLSLYFRSSLSICLHAKLGLRLRPSSPPHEADKLFDAFISYSSKDESWVREVLGRELEAHEPPFRLCLRYRDLPSGGAYLADTIVQAAEASRRTILVLSHHFLKGEWSRSDVKSAHHSVLKERNRKVLIILLGELPSKDLDPDIRLYLKNHTYLSCDDKRFWDKLYYNLPDLRPTKSTLGRCSHGRTSSRSHLPYTEERRESLFTPPHYHSPNLNSQNNSSTHHHHNSQLNSSNHPHSQLNSSTHHNPQLNSLNHPNSQLNSLKHPSSQLNSLNHPNSQLNSLNHPNSQLNSSTHNSGLNSSIHQNSHNNSLNANAHNQHNNSSIYNSSTHGNSNYNSSLNSNYSTSNLNSSNGPRGLGMRTNSSNVHTLVHPPPNGQSAPPPLPPMRNSGQNNSRHMAIHI